MLFNPSKDEDNELGNKLMTIQEKFFNHPSLCQYVKDLLLVGSSLNVLDTIRPDPKPRYRAARAGSQSMHVISQLSSIHISHWLVLKSLANLNKDPPAGSRQSKPLANTNQHTLTNTRIITVLRSGHVDRWMQSLYTIQHF